MKATGRLEPQPWMDTPQVRALFDSLDRAGIAARFVGGCVRNAVLGRAIDDIDMAVDKPPETVMRALEAADLKVVPTGLKHGTVTALVEGSRFELTTLRRDVETDGRRAVVAFTDDWLEDASRRDFTFNALYADRDGMLYDPFDGRSDLAAGRVRFIGDADTRIAEDRLRVLRFFRFHAAGDGRSRRA
jgi:poly(A) polymerase